MHACHHLRRDWAWPDNKLGFLQDHDGRQVLQQPVRNGKGLCIPLAMAESEPGGQHRTGLQSQWGSYENNLG